MFCVGFAAGDVVAGGVEGVAATRGSSLGIDALPMGNSDVVVEKGSVGGRVSE